jgi:hypothetical protein
MTYYNVIFILGAFYISNFIFFLLMDLVQFKPKELSSSQVERTACTSSSERYGR